MRGKRCQLCAAIISPKTRGRPRKFCSGCSPGPGATSARAGRAANPLKVLEYNRARRLSPAQWNERVAR